MKRVAFDARITRQLSVGMRAYTRELAQRLPRIAPDLEFVFFRDATNFGWQEQVSLPLRIKAANVQLAHFTSQYTPAFSPRPYAVTIHDLIHLLYPQNFKRKVGPYYRTVVKLVCARASRVITDDLRTVADLQRFLGVAPERVRVVPLGVDDRFLQPTPPHRAARPYFLYAGNHREHKDLATLFEAWSSLPPHLEVDLYVTGDDDFAGGLDRYAGANRRILPLGQVSVDDLTAYYAGAIALVHPAWREGFGFSMLEAMAAGCPVIACADALPMVLDGAALTFPPKDAPAARAAMQRLLADEGLRKALVNEGRSRAAALTWDRCAIATAQIYREILEESSR